MHNELITARMPVRDIPSLVTVLYEEGRPAEFYIEPEQAASAVGTIVLGKVESVEPGLSAAFVRTGPDARVYMPLTSQTKKIRPGDELPVQIIQDAQKTKLPKADPAWEIAGSFLVLSSKVRRPVFSRKLTGEQKAALTALLSGWEAEDCGILFRTRAASAEPDEVNEEFDQLHQALQEIRQKAATRSCFTVLYVPPCLQERIITRFRPGDLERFQTDDPKLFAAMRDVCEKAGCPAQLYEDPQISLYRLKSLTTLLERLTGTTVPLRSGGSLVIEQTEAFAVIDVNTGRYTGKHDITETVHKINLEAAAEAARQIRLRQLSGTILIDFINSRDPGEEEEIGHILSEAFLRDPVSTKLIDFTKLHICEITRRKIQRPLREQIRALKET